MISILIAVYNGKKYLHETIESALKQTVSKEIILIDDCSDDDSYERLKEFEARYSCIKVIKNEKNIGFCKSVNAGVKVARGEYILVLGQDDVLLQNHCETMLKYFDRDTSIVFCDHDLIDQDSQVYDNSDHCTHTNISIKDFYKKNAIPSVGLMMSRGKLLLVEGYPENEDYPQYGEYHTWIRMALVGKIVFCKEVRARYRRHKANMTNSFDIKEVKIKLNKYFKICKMQIINSPKISWLDKCYIYAYMQYETLKIYVGDKCETKR